MKDYSQFGYRKDYDPKKRIVKQEYILFKGVQLFVSTIDLGMNHSFVDNVDLYYETMIFNPSYDPWYQERYTTREDALEGHNKLIKAFKNDKVTFEHGYLIFIDD